MNPSSSEENSVWKGKPDDLTMSSCNRDVPFPRATLRGISGLEDAAK